MNELRDDRLAQLVRDVYAVRVDDAPDAADLLAAVRRRTAARRRRTTWTVVAAAAACAVLAIGVGLAVRPQAGPGPATPATTSTATRALQSVVYRGVQVQVPSSWPLNDQQCGTPQHDTVITLSGVTYCLAASRPTGLTVVRFTDLATEAGRALAAGAKDPVTVSGRRAYRSVTALNVEPTEVTALVLPGAGVAVSVQSPDQAAAQRILATVRILGSLGPTSDVDDLRRYLETHLPADEFLGFGGRLYCGLDLMGRSADRRYAYVWALCQEYYLDRTSGVVTRGTGSSLPIRVDTTTGALDRPSDGSGSAPDIRRLFPAAIAEAMLANEVHPDRDDAALKAQAQLDPPDPA